MQKIIFIFFISFISVATFAESDAVQTLGISEGVYEVIKRDGDCSEGNLEYVQIEKNVSIKFGIRVLVSDFNLSENKEVERECKFKSTNTLSKGSLFNVYEMSCNKDAPVTRKTKIQKTDDGFGYTVTLEDAAGNVEKTINCTLKRVTEK